MNRIVLTLQKHDIEPLLELVRSYLREDRVSKKEITQNDIHFLPLFIEYEKWIKYSKGKHGHHFLFTRTECQSNDLNVKINIVLASIRSFRA